MQRLISASLLAGFAVATVACTDVDPVEVRSDSTTESIEVHQGSSWELSSEVRAAIPVIFDARLDDNDQFKVELAEAFDSTVYVGPSDDAGDPHQITRASVIDEADETVWTQRITSHYQWLEFLTPVIDEFTPSGLNIGVDQLYDLAVEDYPELLRFPTKIPTELEGADRYLLEIKIDGEQWRQVAEFSIEEIKQQAREPDPDVDYEIENIVDNGPDDDRINIAIMGDGYTEQQREKFEKDAQAVAEQIIETSPIKEHIDLFNIQQIWTPSNESGAGYDCNHGNAPENCEQRFRDTPFRTTFVIPAIADEYGFSSDDISDRVAMPLDIGAIYEIAAEAAYDEVVLLSNTDKFSGFAGAYVAMVTNYDDRDRFPHTAVHELGHTLGLLGDEYYNSSDACYYHEPTIPLPVNIETSDAAADDDREIKWQEWVDEDAQLPTPSYLADRYDIAAFSPAYNCDFLVRPSENCKMNSSRDDFCAICAEQMVRRFYSVVSPAKSGGPQIEVTDDNTVDITAPVREDTATDRYEVVWTVDGQLQQTDAATLSLDRDSLDNDEFTDISVTIRNTSEFLKTHDQVVESTFDFQIRGLEPQE